MYSDEPSYPIWSIIFSYLHTATTCLHLTLNCLLIQRETCRYNKMTSYNQYLWALTITEVPIFWIFKLLYITSRMCLVRSFKSSRFTILYIKTYFFPWLLLTDPYIRQYVFSTTGGITCSSSYNVNKPLVQFCSCKALLYFSIKHNITHS